VTFAAVVRQLSVSVGSLVSEGGARVRESGRRSGRVVLPRELLQRLARVAFAITGDRTRAEDLVQSAVERLLASHTTVDHPAAYLTTVIANLAKDDWRRAAVLSIEPTAYVPDKQFDADEHGSTELRIDVERRLRRLSAQHRTVLVLRFLADLPVAEVARIMDRPAGTVRRLTTEARRAYKSDGDDPKGVLDASPVVAESLE
jgi:RNA polymerase sigma factor (sigma-70 family)